MADDEALVEAMARAILAAGDNANRLKWAKNQAADALAAALALRDSEGSSVLVRREDLEQVGGYSGDEFGPDPSQWPSTVGRPVFVERPHD